MEGQELKELLLRGVVGHKFLHGEGRIEISRSEMLEIDLITSSGKAACFLGCIQLVVYFFFHNSSF